MGLYVFHFTNHSASAPVFWDAKGQTPKGIKRPPSVDPNDPEWNSRLTRICHGAYTQNVIQKGTFYKGMRKREATTDNNNK
ncbi:MAG: hypothetical protein GY820_01835 [Gammaproteobacteria bacterium]|nr:hypothetical protein [Gammaproteobacteria bacterium]